MTAHRPWCADHISYLNAAGTEQVEMCAATPIGVVFSRPDGDEQLLACYSAATDLTEGPDGPTTMLTVNGAPVVELGPRQAAAIGAALLAQAARVLGDEDRAAHYRSMAVVNADMAARALR